MSGNSSDADGEHTGLVKAWRDGEEIALPAAEPRRRWLWPRTVQDDDRYAESAMGVPIPLPER